MLQKFRVPAKITDFVQTIERQREKRLQESIAQQAVEYQKRQQEEKQRRQAWQKHGLPYAKKIMKWTASLRQDRAGQQLITTSKKSGAGWRDGLFFFDAKVEGHAWRGLGTSEKTTWWIQNGCGATENYVQTPEELADAIHPEILQAAWQSIADGTVWHCIQDRLKK